MSVTVLTNDNFEQEVKNAEKTILIDFWATWCGPCKMMSPVIEEIAEENDSIKVCKINVDDEPQLAQMFQIQSIPTFIVIKDNKAVNMSLGVQSKEEILSMID